MQHGVNELKERHNCTAGYNRIYILLMATRPVKILLVNNQLDALFQCIYFTSLHVSSNPMLIIR